MDDLTFEFWLCMQDFSLPLVSVKSWSPNTGMTATEQIWLYLIIYPAMH